MRGRIRWALCISLLLCGGCATLMRGTHQSLKITTDPGGATVQVDGRSYTTPAEVDLPRRQAHQVVISKPGYRTVEFKLDPQWDGMSLVGNMMLPGGSIGFVTDTANGADKAFFDLARVELVPTTRPSEPPLELKDYKGQLLTDGQYAQAVEADLNDRAQFFRGEP